MAARLGMVLAAAALVSCSAPAAGPAPVTREGNRAAVDKILAAAKSKHVGNDDVLVLPALIADRAERTVTLWGEATALGERDIIEFFLVAANSGHDYEAVAVSFAKPSDLHKALVFIGLAAGRPADATKLQFWPKGERVFMTFTCDEEGVEARPIRAERLVRDVVTGKSLPESGLVFVGSVHVPPVDSGGEPVYAADVRQPNAMASNYNEPETVLDVPRQAPQGAVYEQQCVNPETLLPSNRLVRITFTPEYPKSRTRVVELRLNVAARAETSGLTMAELAFELTGQDGKRVADGAGLNAVLQTFTALVEKGHDPFVAVSFARALPMKSVRDVCAILASIETPNGIRLEPPLAGNLYVRAYAPDEEFRAREDRISQPWELRLGMVDGKVSATLVQIEQLWREDRVKPDLKVSEYAVPTPAALRAELDKRGPGIPVLFVFAGPEITHGQVMDFVQPVLPTHGTVHVFLTEVD